MPTPTPSTLTTGGTDSGATSFNTASISPTDGSLVVVVCALYDSGGYAENLSVSGCGQSWTGLTFQGYTSNVGNVSAAYCIASSPSSGALTLTPGAGTNTYDAAAWVVVEFDLVDGAVQSLAFDAANRTSSDTIALQALSALGSPNIVIGYAGAYNTASQTLTFANTTGWTVAAESSVAAGGSGQIAAGLYYGIDGSDTTVDLSVNAASDRLFGGAIEFSYVAASVVTGTATGSASGTGSAVGTRTVFGTAAGAATGAGTATGVRTVLGSAAGASTGTGSATGLRTVFGSGSGNASGSGSAVGSGGTAVTPEEDVFSGTPQSRRELDQKMFDEQLARLLREDEEILCLI